MIREKILLIIKILLVLIINIAIIFLFESFISDRSSCFTDCIWKSKDNPVFYHYFSKKEDTYTVEIHDKSGDMASITEEGVLKGDELWFEGTNDSINIYKYDDGTIYVCNISKDGEKNEFTPLERTENGK